MNLKHFTSMLTIVMQLNSVKDNENCNSMGGLGTRLAETKLIPKPMVKIGKTYY